MRAYPVVPDATKGAGWTASIRAFFVPNYWLIGSFAVACIVLLPVVSVMYLAFFPVENIWPHLFDTVLFGYIRNTLLLMIGVGTGTFLIGTSTAWLVTMCRFPGRAVLEWALLLPLAVPAFVLAYVYTDLLEYAGPVQIALRALFGWQSARDYYFPDVRSLGGAVLMMTLVLYPYVYLLARSAFLDQSVAVMEASRTLGCTPWQSFFRIALPMARPSLVVGLALALMETLNDFGTVDFFAVRTLTAGIFNVWLLMGNLGGGAQVSLVLLFFVVSLIVLERYGRRGRRYHDLSTRRMSLVRFSLSGIRRWMALLICALPVVLGFIIPALQLLFFAVKRFEESCTPQFVDYALNSLLVSSVAAAVATLLALFMGYAGTIRRGRKLASFFVQAASLGYAIPGAVLGVGILVPVGYFNTALQEWVSGTFGISMGQILSGSFIGLVVAYVIRFLALSLGTVQAGFGRIRPSLGMAARTLGYSPRRVLWSVHVPMLRGSLLTAVLLVFVDCMKELPATLLLRPFNFETLATHVYQFASEEMLEQAALASLAIVLTGIVPVIILSLSISSTRRRKDAV
ncbi:iron ABC transporter permease [Haematospirillum jordaniae]|uniref:Iron ABC transporter permease n=1 Tax=Haematospirillum jordaniae TaxID=1549855 RepID=A0A143DEZ5_9PROT|nr:iron ABC transporter permease [Haematospirillum jordaniae]AMW35287.1 iron ABC transporter permease [Haematospirillum jordaniae]NKD45843.1 iron ABC transporter permease [Haematospirillum jordaniae]NKD56306.1 iron ABC transporter permease [Haematospirillum jordaniae]NKD58364.1 iron ABC transporter permease [Haematospirillum jordaniae]NKD66467.1 iron ABC transporter permease [Haematospirillum jordaniae]